jgi:hypothetical protein
MKVFAATLAFGLLVSWSALAQTPIAVTGFNEDTIAEAAPAAASTSASLDSQGFVISGASLPLNGTISGASGTFQLAPQSGLNSLLLAPNTTGLLQLA